MVDWKKTFVWRKIYYISKFSLTVSSADFRPTTRFHFKLCWGISCWPITTQYYCSVRDAFHININTLKWTTQSFIIHLLAMSWHLIYMNSWLDLEKIDTLSYWQCLQTIQFCTSSDDVITFQNDEVFSLFLSSMTLFNPECISEIPCHWRVDLTWLRLKR